MDKALQNKRVLITGASGFIGKHLHRYLNDTGAIVFGASRHKQDKLHQLNLLDSLSIQRWVEDIQPHMVVHLAAAKDRGQGLEQYRQAIETNLVGSFNLIQACSSLKDPPRFVFMGTCQEYGPIQAPFREEDAPSPNGPYGLSKLAVTQFLMGQTAPALLPSVVLRPSIVYGPGQDHGMFLPALIHSLTSGERFPMTKGEQTRDFVYIDDLIEAVALSLVSPTAVGKIINISSSVPVRIADLAKHTADMIGPGAIDLLDIGAVAYRPGESMEYSGSNKRAHEVLSWIPRTKLEDGLRQTIQHFTRR